MGECKLDHSVEDVENKLEDQREYLPENLYQDFKSYLEENVAQTDLNEAFHLLKKYDLASKEEQQDRNGKIEKLLKKK